MTKVEEIDTDVFKREMEYYFVNNLTSKTTNTLSNMLAIDYTHRLAQNKNLREHIDECISRLKIFLGSKFIPDDTFATALELFSIAISKLSDTKDVSQEQKQETLIDAIVSVYFLDNSIEDLKKIKLVLKNLLVGQDIEEVLNYINAEQKLFKSLIDKALKTHQKQSDLNKYVKDSLNVILNKSISLHRKIKDLEKIASISTSALGIAFVVGLSTITFGATLPILMLPASILAIKFSPKIGEKIGKVILNANGFVDSETHSIHKLKSTLANDIKTDVQRPKAEGKTQNLDLSRFKSQKLDLLKDRSIVTNKDIEHRSSIKKQEVKANNHGRIF